MKDPIYRLMELTGTSTVSMEDAVAQAIKHAHKTEKGLAWFQVVETRGNIEKGEGAPLAGDAENRRGGGGISNRRGRVG